MEKTIEELLFDKLRQTRKLSRGMMPKRRRMPHAHCPRPGFGGEMPRGPHGHPGMRKGRMLPRERVLQVILEGGEDGMRQKDILEEVRVNPSSLSELINKLEADNPQWEQYIIPDLENCAGLTGYNIQSIPRFMLFDAQGRLYKSAAPRPSSVETRALIDSLIQ